MVDISKTGATIRTSNILRLQWQRSDEWKAQQKVSLDGQLQTLPQTEVTWCLKSTWHICEESPQRSTMQVGPMRQIFNAPLCGVSLDQEGKDALQFFANMLVMTGHGIIRLLSSDEVILDKVSEVGLSLPDSCENFLVVGPSGSKIVDALLSQSNKDGDTSSRSDKAKERAHTFLVIMSLSTVFLFSGTVFGWGAFSSMLQKEGYYDYLCPKDGQHPCEAQLQALNNAFTLATTFVSLTAFVNGWLVDTLGPTKVTIISGLMNCIGLMGIALTKALPWSKEKAAEGGFDLFLWALLLVAVGGSMTMFIGYQAPFLMPSHFTLLIATWIR
eukprot:symbB.v1.2.005110.t1/scaffold294.1/size237520/8